MRPSRLLLALVTLSATVALESAAEDFHAVSSRGASAILVGEEGRIMRAYPAPHNSIWLSAAKIVDGTLRAAATGASDYFAVGDDGAILQSTDPEGRGITWMLGRAASPGLNLRGLARSFRRMVAVGDSGAVFLSGDFEGNGWTRVDSAAVPTRRTLRGIAGGTFYMAAVGDTGTVIWCRSNAPITWSAATTVPTEKDLRAVAVEPTGSTNPRFWAVGAEGTILKGNPFALEWEALFCPVSNGLNAIALFRLLPDNVLIGIAVGDGGVILRSVGGAIWNVVDSGTQQDLRGIAYTGSGAGGGYVAVGDENTILWSPTGLDWQAVVVPTAPTSSGGIRGSWRKTSPGR